MSHAGRPARPRRRRARHRAAQYTLAVATRVLQYKVCVEMRPMPSVRGEGNKQGTCVDNIDEPLRVLASLAR